jgi:sugar lactone lactonase YvrE
LSLAAKVRDLGILSVCGASRAVAVRSAFLVAAALGAVTGLRAQVDYATPYTFTTLAGKTGVEGNINGTLTSAWFAYPQAVAVDGNGNVYVADTGNYLIRKITSEGVVTTFMTAQAMKNAVNFPTNEGEQGSTLGAFNPAGIAIDSAGNLYVSDTGYHVIWKITSAGAISYIAGNGAATGPMDGVGIGAGFGNLAGLAYDGQGNLYVGDGFTLRKVVVSSGAVTTIAGDPKLFGNADGTGDAARFSGVTGVAIDGSGNIYVTDSPGNFTIRKVTSAGAVTTFAGTAGVVGSADGTGSAAQFNALNGIAVDASGNLYVTVANNTIRKITSAGVVTTLAGTPGSTGSADGTGAAALFNGPFGIAVDSAGDMFVSDSLSNTIRERYAAANAAPTIGTQPASQSVAIGASATFAVQASGVPTPAYQWQFNGTSISGATNPTLTVANVQATSLGTYSVVVTNSAGSVASGPATLSSPGISPAALVVPPRLINISSRAYVGTGANLEIAGFVVSGPPGSTETVLIRGVGPSLAQFGISGALAYPVLTLFNSSGEQIGTNESWYDNSNAPQIVAAEATTGAFPLKYSSTDAGLLVSLPPGSYTAEVSATADFTGVVNTPGVALAEVYEVSNTGAQLVNISTRAYVGTGSNVEIAGIVVTGTAPANVLIRAVGPGLTQFGVSGVLAQPTLTVTDSSGNTIATNTGWSSGSNAASIAAAAASSGAFALTSGSADCAVLLTLQPGSYTAVVSGVGGTSGVALAEAYQVP